MTWRLLHLLTSTPPVCAPLAGAFGGLLASGILKIDKIGSVVRWEMIFLIEGIITTIIGIASYFLMTDRIEKAKWLTQDEKDLANARLKREQVGATVVLDRMNSRAVKQGIFAPTTLAVGFIFLVNNITVQGLAFFTPTIVATIFPTKSTVHKQLFTVPPYVVGACFTVIVSFAVRCLVHQRMSSSLLLPSSRTFPCALRSEESSSASLPQ
jgi:MFS family permease